MTSSYDSRPRWRLARLTSLVRERRALLRDYLAAISGSAGRLVFSLAYFIFLANTLPLADFGIFAAASAAGVMLSRILSFGFISTLYRVATVRPSLIGTFTAGFLLLSALSLPVLAAAAGLVYLLFFEGSLLISVFALIIVAEALFWRPVELVIIVNNGLGFFGRGSLLTILGTAARALAAILFMLQADPSLATWSGYYLSANLAVAVFAFAMFYPRQRLRLRGRLYWRRLPDALYVAGAEVLFYLQMEFDKFIVLAIGGANLAGIYAVIMRLVDLTAIPIRTFTMMLVQKMMRAPALLSNLRLKAGIEIGVFVISTAALMFLALVLHFFPNALGRNIAQAAGLVSFALAIPGLRNLVEYHAELLFARGQTALRALNLALLGAGKAILLALLLLHNEEPAELLWMLNGAFALLYLGSAALTYSALRLPAKRI
ncbi:lipopolysaccharide biosynthesis protein [Pseudaminobacter sp. 19-2017]|uniref:Lipopolysaccharide biosynthesis protein n=1 Tax=Pseudaminobacter soli (ex Zhang et al. 2022) TaxID=2831468 RepID=A0A942E0D7_9HYPH|nr:lipopolysaccharide biosynthesis protein [Pseudaminobacter soli]MBS3648535.1 lipopolysaccharide biosynthesis protein [Pseudaminobacter soli]